MTGTDLHFRISLQQGGGGWLVRADGEPGDQEGGWRAQKTDDKDCTGAVVMQKLLRGRSGEIFRQQKQVRASGCLDEGWGETNKSGTLPRFLAGGPGWRVIPALSEGQEEAGPGDHYRPVGSGVPQRTSLDT